MVEQQKAQDSEHLIIFSILAAFWPVWIWYGQRLCDQSDEPLGIVALITLLYLITYQQSKATSAAASANAASPSSILTSTITSSPVALTAMLALYGLSLFFAPKLISAALALITLALAISHIWRRPLNSGQWILLLLSLPLVASLNFYLGYPLRLVVAQCAVSLLSINGFPVIAQGTSLLWHNQLIEIDAPCSGIKMLWAALYLAAVQLSLRNSKPTQAILYLILGTTAAVFANVLRVTSLFYLEAGIIAAPAQIPKLFTHQFFAPQSFAALFETAVHTGTGVAAFLLVVLILFFVDKRFGRSLTIGKSLTSEALEICAEANQSASQLNEPKEKRSGYKPLFIACATAALLPFCSLHKLTDGSVDQSSTVTSSQVGTGGNQANWPTEYEGQKLRPLPLSGSEEEFAKNFPGKIAVFQTDKQTIIFRRVNQATRQLHPAADCYRASGFKITNLPRQTDQAGINWNVLEAQKSTRHLEVRERIYDDYGHNYTDVSQWYWAAFWSQTKGPWCSITTVTALRK